MLITYFGSGICSHSRRMGTAILSVTVPLITTRSACRADAGDGITPRRMTSYRGDPKAAPISMAQQARPHWYTQSEYLRAVFNSVVSGFGIRPFSTRPTEAHLSATHRAGPGRG